jgi:hypothetical protein
MKFVLARLLILVTTQVVKGVFDDFYSFEQKKPERFRRGAIFVQA